MPYKTNYFANMIILFFNICWQLLRWIRKAVPEPLLTIFSVMSSQKTISGSTTATISANLPQFLTDPPNNKSNVFERDWWNFDQENFVLDYFDTDWPNILKLNSMKKKNVNLAANNFLDAINSVLNKYVPLRISIKFRLKKKNLDDFWYSKINLY